jgi:alpha-tubulin suppressor-like RCC1 family protein
MQIGDSFQLGVSVIGIESQKVYYETIPMPSSVALVSTDGLVVANSAGSVGLIIRSAQYGEKIDTARFSVATPAPRLTFTSLSSNDAFSCGLTKAGDAYCWGGNRNRILGVAPRSACSTLYRPGALDCNVVPERMMNVPKFARLADMSETYPDAGHACALTDDGSAFCWGENAFGELGNGTRTRSSIPAVIPNLKFSAISTGGARTCGVTIGGELYCWGMVYPTTFGNQTFRSDLCTPDRCRTAPSIVAPQIRFRSVSLGSNHSCAVTTFDEVYCWGFNDFGELGDSSTAAATDPVRVAGGLHFKSVSARNSNSCGVSTDGQGYCWGYGDGGHLGTDSITKDCNPHPLGTGPTLCATSPVRVGMSQQLSEIVFGINGTCARTLAGQIFCWGTPNRTNYGTRPTLFSSAIWKSLTGAWNFCALDAAGFAYCWGDAAGGRIGNGQVTYDFLGRYYTDPIAVAGPRFP